MPQSPRVSQASATIIPKFNRDKLAGAVTVAMMALASQASWAAGIDGQQATFGSAAGGLHGVADTSGEEDGYNGGDGGNAGLFGQDGDAASSGASSSLSPDGGYNTSSFAGGGGAGGHGGAYGAGGGGGGGSTAAKRNSAAMSVAGGVTFAGGNGGKGGDGAIDSGVAYSTGGGGGAGGNGMVLTSPTGATLSVMGTIRGGNGGAAGAGLLNDGTGVYNGASGGEGGFGLVFTDGNANLTVAPMGLIQGGKGGDGARNASSVAEGSGGRGAIGVMFNGTGNTLTNSGTIVGGAGGAGGNGATNTNYRPGDGAEAILGNGVSIINSGTIVGGFAGDGVTRANAISLYGTDNRLELRSGSAILGVVQVTGDGTLALGGTANQSFDVSQVGPGGQYRGFNAFEKTGSSTATLTGTTSAVTPWTLTSGKLAVTSDAALGDSAGDLTFKGGTLQISGTSFDSQRAMHLSGADGIIEVVGQSDKAMMKGNIDGNGGLTVNGSGQLIVTGNNTYTGTTTVGGDASLVFGNGGTTGSLPGDLVIGSNATAGFNRSDNIVYGGTISGAGFFIQGGPGKLTLTGDSSAYSGIAAVTAGELEVNGNLSGSRIGVFGGTLSGTGQLGLTQVSAGGTLSPGNAAAPTGTLTVNGILLMTTGSTLRITAAPDGSHSKVVVNGQAQLGGSVMQLGTQGNYAASTTYNIIEATNGISGTFSSVNSDYAYLAPALTYDANKVNLVVNLKDVPVDPGTGTGGPSNPGNPDSGSGSNGNGGNPTRPIQFADLANTPNQRSVANALQSLPTSSALYSRVLNLPNGAPAGVFESLSGEAHASVANTLNGVTGNVVSLPMAHLRANMAAGLRAGPPTAQLGRGDASALPQSDAQPVWAQVFGNWRTLSGGDDSAKVRQSDGGVFVGGDQGVGGGWRLGGAVGYTGSHSSLKGLSSRADVDSYSGVIYGGKAFEAGPGKINLTLGAAYTWHDIDTERSVNAAGVGQDLKASYSASTTQFFTELGYALPLNTRVTLEPFVGADFSDQRTRGFGESGGDAALMGKSSHDQVGSTTLGLRAQYAFESGNAQGRLHGSAGWRHSYGDLNPSTTMAFDGSQSFSVVGAPIARDAAVVTLGVDMAVTRNTTVGLTYGGQFGDGNRQNSGTLDVRYRF